MKPVQQQMLWRLYLPILVCFFTLSNDHHNTLLPVATSESAFSFVSAAGHIVDHATIPRRRPVPSNPGSGSSSESGSVNRASQQSDVPEMSATITNVHEDSPYIESDATFAGSDGGSARSSNKPRSFTHVAQRFTRMFDIPSSTGFETDPSFAVVQPKPRRVGFAVDEPPSGVPTLPPPNMGDTFTSSASSAALALTAAAAPEELADSHAAFPTSPREFHLTSQPFGSQSPSSFRSATSTHNQPSNIMSRGRPPSMHSRAHMFHRSTLHPPIPSASMHPPPVTRAETGEDQEDNDKEEENDGADREEAQQVFVPPPLPVNPQALSGARSLPDLRGDARQSAELARRGGDRPAAGVYPQPGGHTAGASSLSLPRNVQPPSLPRSGAMTPTTHLQQQQQQQRSQAKAAAGGETTSWRNRLTKPFNRKRSKSASSMRSAAAAENVKAGNDAFDRLNEVQIQSLPSTHLPFGRTSRAPPVASVRSDLMPASHAATAGDSSSNSVRSFDGGDRFDETPRTDLYLIDVKQQMGDIKTRLHELERFKMHMAEHAIIDVEQVNKIVTQHLGPELHPLREGMSAILKRLPDGATPAVDDAVARRLDALEANNKALHVQNEILTKNMQELKKQFVASTDQIFHVYSKLIKMVNVDDQSSSVQMKSHAIQEPQQHRQFYTPSPLQNHASTLPPGVGPYYPAHMPQEGTPPFAGSLHSGSMQSPFSPMHQAGSSAGSTPMEQQQMMSPQHMEYTSYGQQPPMTPQQQFSYMQMHPQQQHSRQHPQQGHQRQPAASSRGQQQPGSSRVRFKEN